MSQVIITKYIGPTNTRGSRVKATSWRKTVTVSWDAARGTDENHTAACEALMRAMESDSEYKFSIVGHGPMPDDSGRAYLVSIE